MGIKKTLGTLASIVLAGAVALGIGNKAKADHIWTEHGGNKYSLTENYGTWQMCENEAKNAGGHLAAINDTNENSWLTQNFEGYGQGAQGVPTGSLLWIGLYNAEGGWKWSNGESITYMAPWYSGSPSNGIHGYIHPHTSPFAVTWWNFALHDSDSPEYWPKGIIELETPPTPPQQGDANLDGYVDVIDLITLARNWNRTPATWKQGNFNNDSTIDLADLVIIARNWTGYVPPSQQVVPEPSTIGLLAAGGLVGLLRRREKKN